MGWLLVGMLAFGGDYTSDRRRCLESAGNRDWSALRIVAAPGQIH
jgi:hypothetical protein